MKTDKLQSQKQDVADYEGAFEFINVPEEAVVHMTIWTLITRDYQNMTINETGHIMYEKLLKHLYSTEAGLALSNIFIDDNIDEVTKMYMSNLFDYAVQEAIVIGKIINKDS